MKSSRNTQTNFLIRRAFLVQTGLFFLDGDTLDRTLLKFLIVNYMDSKNRASIFISEWLP